MTKKKNIKIERDKPVFIKSDLLKSKRYALKRDILNALLEDGKTYTIEQVDNIIETFLSKEVK